MDVLVQRAIAAAGYHVARIMFEPESDPRWIGEHWQVILGPLLVLAVIFFRRGLAGIFQKRDE